MLVDDRKIQRILQMSKKVFRDCSLRNGAIVASNIHDSDYPKGMKNYYYVWLRDASFVCVACDLLGMKEIPEKFFKWSWHKPEGFRKKGIFFMRYHPNGKMYGREFQPDQTGSLIWAIEHHSKYHGITKFHTLIEKAADGICSSWKGSHFRRSFDLWEEKPASSRKNEKHTYSLAMCIKGLEAATELIKTKETWLNCKEEMENELKNSYNKNLGHFVRTFNKKHNKILDSSMLGLVWPSGVMKPNDKRMVSTVKKIIQINSIKDGGIIRYKGDRYIGKLRRGKAGAWPILNFWLSIYFSKLKKEKKALKYFDWVIERVDEKLPEQIKNDEPFSIIPLTWSHAMFVIAGRFLELF